MAHQLASQLNHGAHNSAESIDLDDQEEIGHEGEENFVGDSEIIALGGASNETKDRPLG